MKKSFYLSPLTALFLVVFCYSCLNSSSISPNEKPKFKLTLDTPFVADKVIDTTKIPVLKINESFSNNIKPLKINSLKTDVKIVGTVALTTIEFIFHNPNSSVLEGELEFPLGKSQSISKFAMDVDGSLRHAVVVEKNKGRKVFEEITRRNIDPGLAEMTKGNIFKIRVYPIPANGNKRVIIAYTQELNQKSEALYYHLPLDYNQIIEQFSLRIEVHESEIKPKINNGQIDNLKFNKWNKAYVVEKYIKKHLAKGQIIVSIPKTKKVKPTVFIEKDNQNNNFFYANIPLQQKQFPKTIPNKISIFWDNSHSSFERDINKDLDFLKSYFKLIDNVEVELHLFSNDIIETKLYGGLNKTISTLYEDLNKLTPDGATSFNKINFDSIFADEILFFTDGIESLGKANFKEKDIPIYCINSSIKANHALLEHIATSSSGKYIDLTSSNIRSAVYEMQNINYQFLYATYDDTKIDELFPKSRTNIDNNFSISGILKSEKCNLTLYFGIDNNVLESINLNIDSKNHFNYNNLIPRLWASKKLFSLQKDETKNKKEILELGRKHNIVTPNTSLIVLDNLMDYVQHQITPPEDLQEEYYKILSTRNSNSKDEKDKHLETVIMQFQNRIDWWNTDFSLTVKDIKRKNKPLMYREIDIVEDDISVDYEEAIADEEMLVLSRDMSNSGIRRESMPLPPACKKSSKRAKIIIEKWNSSANYMDSLKDCSDDKLYDRYLSLKKHYIKIPVFYIDMSNLFFDKGQTKNGIRILSNLLEFESENHEHIRVVAHTLKYRKEYQLAEIIYRDIIEIRDEEPQSYRDLALVCSKTGKNQEAIELLYKVVANKWDSRFRLIHITALGELNSIINSDSLNLDFSFIDKRLIKHLPTDLRVVMDWDANNCDIDMWVIDPYGNKCYYSNKNTRIGGRLEYDFTQGYGPEEFLLKNAPKGKYTVQANYYGSSRQKASGHPTIYTRLITQNGKSSEQEDVLMFRLEKNKQVVTVGTFEVK